MGAEPVPGDDPRWHRTEDALRRALVEVGSRSGLDALTVTAVVREARVGRSTFYRHHHSVDAFVDTLRDELLAHLVEAFRDARHRAGPDSDRYRTVTGRVRSVLLTVHEHAKVFGLLWSGPEGTAFRGRCRELLAELVAEDLDLLGVRIDADYCPPEYVIAFLVHTVFAVVDTWLAKPTPEPVEDVTFFLTALISGGAEFL
ncbi:hypothetical protein [Streptomyces sp. NPDC046909]|uniref:TetR/AcrR family transcriptional regulator n=1 Tax=Streptomyces sp. NPDC046909 TaxID=3155617 RepID=UPI0033D7DC9A